MGSREFKNTLPLKERTYGLERRQNLTKEELSNSSPLPMPLNYEDIDKEFKRWVDEDLEIVADGKRIPTYTLYSNQRFSEYMQSWEHTDEKKNPILNFKTITRESNPQSGTILGQSKNIPGEKTFLMNRIEARDKNDRPYYIEYRMKQPIPVDFRYTVSIMTNKYELLNKFNLLINDKFKAIDCYVRVKGHFISMKCENISDESQYSIDDRQFYSQSCIILVTSYIIPEDSFEVKEVPNMKFIALEGFGDEESYVEVEELPCANPKNDYYYKPVTVKVNLGICDDKIKFIMDCDFTLEKIEVENNRSFQMKINDEPVTDFNNLVIKEGSEVKIYKVKRFYTTSCSVINLVGGERNVVYDHKNDKQEFAKNDKQFEEIKVVEFEDSKCNP